MEEAKKRDQVISLLEVLTLWKHNLEGRLGKLDMAKEAVDNLKQKVEAATGKEKESYNRVYEGLSNRYNATLQRYDAENEVYLLHKKAFGWTIPLYLRTQDATIEAAFVERFKGFIIQRSSYGAKKKESP